MRILVTGGAGYIGSVVTEVLLRDGHHVVVYDSLRKGHRRAVAEPAVLVQADLGAAGTLQETLQAHGIEAVIHMAADSLVGESMRDPWKYYDTNVTAGLSLLLAMSRSGVRRIVFSSTAAVYGEPAKQPIEESDPVQPTNPYGETKLAFERALHWFESACGISYASLRYFNAAGATRLCGEVHEPETHLIPIVLEAAAGSRDLVEVYGDDYPTRDGTCVRDYIHVADLARAHVLALGKLDRGSAVYNLGCGGEGYTVLEVIETARRVTGRSIPLRIGGRRPGDPAILVASSRKICEELQWQPELQRLDTIVESAWRWMREHPEGYSE